MISFQRLTADGAVLSSGRAVAVYGLCIIGTGDTTVLLRNGTSASDAIAIAATGLAGVSRMVNFSDVGVVFPSGCYVDVDANIEAVTVLYEAI